MQSPGRILTLLYARTWHDRAVYQPYSLVSYMAIRTMNNTGWQNA